ncbi:MAG: hypothetical protein JWO91_3242 [Acidobacteriaceae bacterium]|nr:hypothetical protein [Acidobacteriaceae bacterium]
MFCRKATIWFSSWSVKLDTVEAGHASASEGAAFTEDSVTHLCVTCGTQFPPADNPPSHCPICADERQFVGLQGQQWITLEQLQRTNRNALYQEGEDIWGITTVPTFGIGQRALFIRTGKGNILWDCVSLIDSDTVALINALGGISENSNFPSSLLRFHGRVESGVRRRSYVRLAALLRPLRGHAEQRAHVQSHAGM